MVYSRYKIAYALRDMSDLERKVQIRKREM